ncbi:hypothetical protein SSX86_030201 [Deinandra increscens subsp. villosa]|uniref:Glycosyltransferase n=1 Tax=Deinandra increscens subsp. villosa TaxID=3103831 RepID=A0AAP0CCA1_9ASTR
MDLEPEKKPHALCIPAPAQGHINPMLKLAKILHSKGFLITFVNTEFNHQRLVRSRGPEAVHNIPVGVCANLNPIFFLFTDPSYLRNGYLDTVLDFIPTMSGIRLKDIPPFVRILNPGDDFMVGFSDRELYRARSATGIIFNTFNALDCDALDTLSITFPNCYGIGPLHLLENNIVDNSLDSIKYNLWKEDPQCLKSLDAKEPNSVIYVNFGSITVMTHEQLVEFCWGLAKSNHSFLWIIRPNLVIGDSAVLPQEFLAETSDRGLLTGWCSQEEVLSHPSIGGFLTHSGWNSTIESISSGVPMICWPFFADQQPNCWWSCNKWRIAMEIDNNVTSDEVSKLLIELMTGEKGNAMTKNAIDWKNKAEKACNFPSASSMVNLEKLIHLGAVSSLGFER